MILRNNKLMDNPGLPTALWRELEGGLWHATSKDGLLGIASTGRILHGNANRYLNSFCLSRSAVSLFDFGESAVDDWNQSKNWFGWFGSEQNTRIAVWLRIDRAVVQSRLMDSRAAHSAWSDQPSLRFIPGVEACHLGYISRDAIEGFLLVDRCDRASFRYVGANWRERVGEINEFEQSLRPEPTDGLAARLNAAQRARRAHTSDG